MASSAKALSAKFGTKFGGVAAWEYFNSEPNPKEPWRWAKEMKAAMSQDSVESGKAEEDEREEAIKRSRVWRGDE